MLYIISDFKTEISEFIFSSLNRDDVKLINHPSKTKGVVQKIKRFIECGVPVKMNIFYSDELVCLLEKIKPDDDVLLFSIGNVKDLLILKKYLGSRRVSSFLWNPVIEHHGEKIKAARRLNGLMNISDQIYTFDNCDAEKFGLNFVSQPYRYVDNESCEEIYDFYFVGYDKNRIAWLMRFKEIADDLSMRCYFHVLPDKGKKYSSAEKYFLKNAHLSYAENIKIARSSKCLLEVLQKTQSGATLRSVEALFLGKKLITNRPGIINEEYFHESRNLFVSNMDDFDSNSLKSFMDDPCLDVGDNILMKYDINGWVENFISLCERPMPIIKEGVVHSQ